MGLDEGLPIAATAASPVAIATAAPNLQAPTQLFLKTNLGIAAQPVGPGGNQSVARRITMDAPTSSLVVDKHATSWDSLQLAENTTISTFTVSLVDFYGAPVDLNGQNWSFSIIIFRDM